MMLERPPTPYWKWVEGEGLPIIEGHGVEDVRAVELVPWARTGGKGAFVRLYGMEGLTGLYLAEIPPGGALNPEKHMYEKVITVLDGRGFTEILHDDGSKQFFEWGRGSVFSPPLNFRHRLINGGQEPVRFMAVTNAPVVFDVFHTPDFVFNCDYRFTDRYDAREGYFAVGDKRYQQGRHNSNVWETNFIPDLEKATVDPHEVKGSGVRITGFEMCENSLNGHMSAWPVGRYHKAHYHGPGAVLLILRSEGYVLIWPKQAGVRPYENGHEEDVVEFHWKPGSIYTPPSGWFHQHLNTGPEPALQLAVRYGTRRHPVEFKLAVAGSHDAVMTSIREGGTLIDYEDEDPEIRRRFEAALAAKGIPSGMPPVAYRSEAVLV
jgi:oxalate decarboxylase/phosphoglucose isomerase-like protein (cupin superfamily)